MSIIIGRLCTLAGGLLLAWVLVAAGFQLALWAIRTGRVNMTNVKRWTRG